MSVVKEVRKRKPKFNTIDEMTEFFDRTNSRELDWEDSNLVFERQKMKHISIRIPEEDLKIIRHRANELGIGHTAMIRMILHRSVNQNRKRVKTHNSFRNKYIQERVLEISAYLLETKATIRQAAQVFGVSESTVHKDLTERLPLINKEMAMQVKKVLDNHHLREKGAKKLKITPA